jgi:N-acetylmuramic acid 6-phosphate (MurNAc-6-P) etherase
VSGVDSAAAERALDAANNDIKIAALIATGMKAEEAAHLLSRSCGNLRTALASARAS